MQNSNETSIDKGKEIITLLEALRVKCNNVIHLKGQEFENLKFSIKEIIEIIESEYRNSYYTAE